MNNETVDVPYVPLENSEKISDKEIQNIVPASDRVLKDRDLIELPARYKHSINIACYEPVTFEQAISCA